MRNKTFFFWPKVKSNAQFSMFMGAGLVSYHVPVTMREKMKIVGFLSLVPLLSE